MNDFFTRLVARTRADPSALQPNLASYFAPPPPTTSATHGLELIEAENEPSRPSSRLGSSTTKQDKTPPADAPQPPQNMGRQNSSLVLSIQVDPSPIPPTITAALPVVPSSPPNGGEVTEEISTPAKLSSHVPSSSAKNLSLSSPIPLTPEELTSIRPSIRTIPKSSGPIMAKPSRSNRLAPPLRPEKTTTHASTYPNVISSVVHVTIGRLEIRAVTSPPATSVERPTPNAPKLSLDDYLRHSNGGAR